MAQSRMTTREHLHSVLGQSTAPSGEVLHLLQDWWLSHGTTFKTKMSPAKAPRIENLVWQSPVLEFTITRHPGWNRIQRWSYDFTANRATLVREQGEIRNGRYSADDVDNDAAVIVEALLHGQAHPCVRRADGLVTVALSKLAVTHAVPYQLPVRTAKGRQERLKGRVAELVQAHPKYHRIPLVESWSTLVYREPSQAESEKATHPTRSKG